MSTRTRLPRVHNPVIRTPALLVVVLLAALTVPSVTAAPGDLDPSFAGESVNEANLRGLYAAD